MKLKFWITIGGKISDEEAVRFWKSIRHNKEVNFMILEKEMYVYGETAEYVLQDIVYHCVKLGYPIQLHN